MFIFFLAINDITEITRSIPQSVKIRSYIQQLINFAYYRDWKLGLHLYDTAAEVELKLNMFLSFIKELQLLL